MDEMILRSKKPTETIQSQILIVLLGTILLRVIFNEVCSLFNIGGVPLFFSPTDIFADSIKQCLAARTVSSPLLTDPRVLSWPPIFQRYLFSNPYLGPTISIYAQPPLALLQLMSLAKVIVLSGPLTGLLLQFAGYFFSVYLLAALFKASFHDSQSIKFWVIAIFFLSYPSLFMFDRGNFHAGYASLAVCLYIVSAFTARWRWFGWFCISCAINLRPNIAVLMIVETALSPTIYNSVVAQARILLITLGIAVLSAILAHAIDPNYTFSSFSNAYEAFQNTYIRHDEGLFWNISIFAGLRCLWLMYGAHPSYTPIVSECLWLLAFTMAAIYLFFLLKKRLTKIEAIFIASALCIIFTPFDGEYHILKFFAPLLVIVHSLIRQGTPICLARLWPILGALISLGLLGNLAPSEYSVTLIVSIIILTVAMFWIMAPNLSNLTTPENVCLLSSITVLCPLGGNLTLGPEVSLLLFLSTTTIFIASGWSLFYDWRLRLLESRS